jgi:acetoin utilization protein AcuB
LKHQDVGGPNMIVSMWMTKNPVTVPLQTSIADAAALMARRRIRRLPVMDGPSSQTLAGILSATDILRAFPPDVNPLAMPSNGASEHLAVEDIMRRNPVTTAPDEPIEEVARVMGTQKIGALPVLREGRLVGMITESDIFRAFVSVFNTDSSGARITFDVSQGEDTFALIAQVAVQRKVRVVSLISSSQNDLPVCVVRVTGAGVEEMLDDLWKSGHRVINVLRH